MNGITRVYVGDDGEVTPVETPVRPPPNNGRGRPKGTKNLRTKESSRVLAQLGFDPIAEKVRLYDECTRKIATEERSHKPSKMYLAQLMAIKDKCANDLIRFGYARVTESIDVNNTVNEIPAMVVMTTPKGWKLGDATPVTDTDYNDIPLLDQQPTDDDEVPDYTRQGERRLEQLANEEDYE